jgi:hypothetical protein
MQKIHQKVVSQNVLLVFFLKQLDTDEKKARNDNSTTFR